MDTEKIIEFLEKVAEQLGQAGTDAFRIVAQRVFAESLVGLLVGLLILIPVLIVGIKLILWGKNHEPENSRDEDGPIVMLIGGAVLFFGSCISAIFILPNMINLLSLEYTTINRIITLVGTAT